MLKTLHINNFALIENLEVDFKDGFSSITGETGAGKSIILGAIDLLRGRRSETKMLRNKELKAVIEAEFNIKGKFEVEKFLRDNGFDINTDGSLILRREISASGRTRAFVNDSPANLGNLEQLSSFLIDVHSQHQTQAIVADSKMRLKFIDALDNDFSLQLKYQNLFNSYIELRNKTRKLRSEIDRDKIKKESLEFQYNRLTKLNIKLGEQFQLEQRYRFLSNADKIKASIEESTSLIRLLPDSAISNLEKVVSYLSKKDIQTYNSSIANITLRLENSIIELKDIYEELDHLGSLLQMHDSSDLLKIESRLNEIYEAQLEFKLKNADDLYNLKIEIENQLKQSNVNTEELKILEMAMKQKASELQDCAASLTSKRQILARKFSQLVETSSKSLGLANIKFEAQITPAKLSPTGADYVEFLCAFNKNQPLMNLQQTASGGETSRLMLCMKGIIADKTDLPTIIFDEIDTGVSGEIASKVGKLMQNMGKRLQVLAITHLPQVAVSANRQYKVFKTDNETDTSTQIKRLSKEERELEIAKMLSGASVDNAAIRNAKALLKEANKD